MTGYKDYDKAQSVNITIDMGKVDRKKYPLFLEENVMKGSGFHIESDCIVYDKVIPLILKGYRYVDLDGVRFPINKLSSAQFEANMEFAGINMQTPFPPGTAVHIVVGILGAGGRSVYSFGIAGDLSGQHALDNQQTPFGVFWSGNPIGYAESLTIGVELIT